MSRSNQTHLEERHLAIEGVVAAIGLTLVIAAIAADQRWLDRHFLPSFFLPRVWYVRVETTVRVAAGTIGVLLALVMRRRIGRGIGRAPSRAFLVAVAVVAALGASEAALRRTDPRPSEWQPEQEPLGIPDARMGWVVAPARTGRRVFGGRTIQYAVDRAGYRVRDVDEPVDPTRPTIVFVGESVMFGEGLQWAETVPAQVEAMLNVQSANLAVDGYTTAQMYLRLEKELPRFRRPLAVVCLFMTALFGRDLDKNRPYLGPGLVWLPAEHGWRIRSLAEFLVPYRSEATVQSGIAITHDVLRATIALARRRGATPLIVVPQLGSEDRMEEALRQRIVDDTLPSLMVTVDESWHLPWNRHPNARAAHAIASAIAERLVSPP